MLTRVSNIAYYHWKLLKKHGLYFYRLPGADNTAVHVWLNEKKIVQEHMEM